MKHFFKGLVPLFLTITTLANIDLHGANSSNYNMRGNNDGAEKNIVEIAQSNGDFTTLVDALVAANLVSVLEGPGPFTVFAPTNQAFDKLPAGTLNNLLKPENKAKLASILTYHVVPSKILAADVKTMKVKTVNGKDLDIKVNGSNVTVNGARVVKTDIVGSNGVIHVIDTVLIP